MKNTIISNQSELDRKIKNIKKAGVCELQVVSDFDKTLTKCFNQDKKVVSLMSILRLENYLSKDYSKKATALFEKYHPLEIDSTISYEKRDKLMQEWWNSHYRLLSESGLRKEDISKVLESDFIKLRKGVKDFIDKAKDLKMPIIIMSANGLGVDSIKIFLDKEGVDQSDIWIASNQLEWDEKGVSQGVREPIMHSVNKNYLILDKFDFFKKIKNKQNVLLLGDSLNDCDMCNGHEFENIIKIGFLNENIEKNKEVYLKKYDVVILDDGNFDYVNKLLDKLAR